MRIARGATRTAIVGSRWTVKLPSCRDFGATGRFSGFCVGYLANAWERLWSSVPADGVNPVLWHLGPINVYRTCEPVMVGLDFDYGSVSSMDVHVDPKAENLGIHPELGLVWIDYG